jgi:hypothetical protein
MVSALASYGVRAGFKSRQSIESLLVHVDEARLEMIQPQKTLLKTACMFGTFISSFKNCSAKDCSANVVVAELFVTPSPADEENNRG